MCLQGKHLPQILPPNVQGIITPDRQKVQCDTSTEGSAKKELLVRYTSFKLLNI